MTVVLATWAGIGTVLAATARLAIGSLWHRAVGGGFIWPTFPVLIAISRIRYDLRRRSAP